METKNKKERRKNLSATEEKYDGYNRVETLNTSWQVGGWLVVGGGGGSGCDYGHP